MLIFVANLGSTSFKYKLYDMPSQRVLVSGASDRIGEPSGAWSVSGDGVDEQGEAEQRDHRRSIELHLAKLVEHGVIDSPDAIDAIGFKAVHGGPISGAVRVDDTVLDTMRSLYPLAPAHNPPYVEAMLGFREALPTAEQVAAFETGFHADIPLARQVYGVPYDWYEKHGVRRYGFHGASNAYVAMQMAEIAPECKRIINLHLGGSCSVCAIHDGKSVAHSMGATPQTGVFHANRAGEFDPFAVLALRDAGLEEEAIYQGLGKQGGLLGLSGVGADLRDIRAAAEQGHGRAQLAVDAFVESCRHYLGAYLAVLGGVDAITFTAGIGQYEPAIRAAICKNLDFAGITLDPQRNTDATGTADQRLDDPALGGAQIWVVPTNEELVVARQTADVLNQVTV
ncbi:MAG: acetate/propionate family kinase [Phycisphaerales bacterium JB063]